MTEEAQFAQEIDKARNKNCVHCQFCNSIMLKQQSGKYVETKVSVYLNAFSQLDSRSHTHKHTHTYTHMYVGMCIESNYSNSSVCMFVHVSCL